MTAQSGRASLSCGCERVYNPLPTLGDTVYCARHPNTATTVLSLPDRSWRGRCREKGCRFGRLGSEAEVTTFANSHTLKFPDHEVALYHHEVLQRYIDLDGGQTFDGIGQAVADALTEPWPVPAPCGHAGCSYACNRRDGEMPF